MEKNDITVDPFPDWLNDPSDRVAAALVKQRVSPALKIVSTAYIATNYFHKTRAWLTQKLNANIVNGFPATFTKDEVKQLKEALLDISEKIKSTAESL